MAATNRDIRLQVSLPNHHKTKKLLKRLGGDGAWGLICLFLWSAQNRPDGCLHGLSDLDIELSSDWRGQEGAFVPLLAEIGFLDGQQSLRSIHDWADHQGWAAGAAERSTVARNNANSRWAKERAKRLQQEQAELKALQFDAQGMQGDANRMHVASSGNAPSPSPSPAPTPTPTPKSKQQEREQRISEITNDAVATYNAAAFTKCNGGNCPNVTLVGDERRRNVARCLKTARQICEKLYSSQKITRQFWIHYWQSVDADDHKSGRTGGGPNHKGWVPDFEYLTRPDVVTQVFDRAMSEAPQHQPESSHG